MTRVVRNAAALCVVGILVASAALANVPDPSKTTMTGGGYIDVEGSTAGQPDNCSDGKCGNLTITVRDFANNIIAGSTVVIDFSACSDIQLSCDQLNAVTQQSYLGGKKVAGTTTAGGTFVFKVQGASNATTTTTNTTSPGTNAGVACAQVYADGVSIGGLKVVAYDVNGLGSPSGAVNGADVATVSAENAKIALGAQPRQRDDYNHSGTVNGADVSQISSMSSQAALGTGTQKTAPFCP
jgi:hypothetical protein